MISTQEDAGALVTIGDLVADASLVITAVVLRPGASERPVSWVHATEQLDPRPHLRRHELVCTLGSALVRPGSAEVFVAALADAGVSGIALGLGEVHLEPPGELVRACERAEMPLLLLDHGVPFLAVNDVVLERRTQIESETRRRETALISRLLTMAREGAGETALLEEAEQVLGGSLTRVTAPERGIEWAGEPGGATNEFLQQLQSVIEFTGLEHAREASDQQQRLGQLIDLIAGGLALPAAILPEIEAHGLERERLGVSCWPSGSEGALSRRGAIGLIGVTPHEVVLISEPGLEESFRDLGLVCGYSSIVDLAGLRRALSEARSALRLARSRGGVAGPEQLVTLEALLEQQPAEQLNPFIEQLIAPILQAEEQGRGELLTTLRTFIAADRHLQVTADRLYVHVNTVRHRMKRIRELSGRDPLSPSDLVDLRIALWALERRKAVQHRLIRPLSRER
ncbi:PucR family transcriptional regulator [Leucobacter sp.]